MRYLTIFCLAGLFTLCNAQDTITLLHCHKLAVENAPRLKDRVVIQLTGDLRIENAETNWFPEMNLNGKASYQSDVVTLALSDPSIPVDFPKVPHDQYGLNLDISQMIYDGGMTKRQKAYEQSSVAVDLQKVEIDLYKLKERLNIYYFSILILQENKKNLELTLENLTEREKLLQAGIENGLLLESEIKVLQVEMLKIMHSMVEIDASKKAFTKMLGTYMGVELHEEILLQKPYFDNSRKSEGQRPEFKWFELKSMTLEVGKELTKSKRLPVLYAFGQAGYGRPGYNILNDQWDLYYMIGAGLKWNIWDWSKNRREREILEQHQNSINNSRDTFEQNIRAMMVKEEARMEQYSKSLELDEKMLMLQMEIAEEAGSKLENGIMTASDYIIEMNKENMARIRLGTDKILLTQAIANYMAINGTL